MQASMDVCEAGVLSMHEALEPWITENGLWAKLHETNIIALPDQNQYNPALLHGNFDITR